MLRTAHTCAVHTLLQHPQLHSINRCYLPRRYDKQHVYISPVKSYHHTCFHRSTNMWCKGHIMKLLTMKSSSPSSTFALLCASIYLSKLYSNTVHLLHCSLTDLQSQKTTGVNPFQPKLISVHTTVTGTCRRA